MFSLSIERQPLRQCIYFVRQHIRNVVADMAPQRVPARSDIALPPGAQGFDAELPAIGELGFQQDGVVHVFLLHSPYDTAVPGGSQVESVCFVDMGKCYQISAARNCFQELLPLLATCSATYAAVQVHTARRFSSAPDHVFVITCKHLDARVALPLHGPIEDALQNRKPEGVGIGVLDGRGSIPTPGFESAGFKDLFDRMIHPYVVNQFERGRLAIEGKFSVDRTKWPPPWQMGWLIRNGLAHGGTVHFDLRRNPNPNPVIWHGLSISAKQQDEVILGNFVNVGDLIVLSLEMEEDLNGPLPSVPMEDQPRRVLA